MLYSKLFNTVHLDLSFVKFPNFLNFLPTLKLLFSVFGQCKYSCIVTVTLIGFASC